MLTAPVYIAIGSWKEGTCFLGQHSENMSLLVDDQSSQSPQELDYLIHPASTFLYIVWWSAMDKFCFCEIMAKITLQISCFRSINNLEQFKHDPGTWFVCKQLHQVEICFWNIVCSTPGAFLPYAPKVVCIWIYSWSLFDLECYSRLFMLAPGAYVWWIISIVL